MNRNEISGIVSSQKNFFATGTTKDITFRKEMLLRLKYAIIDNTDLITEALKADLNKCETESYMTEIGMVLEEISTHLKNINRWAKVKKTRTPMVHFKSKSYILPVPYGVALIMSPWNYPINLSLSPLIGAISAGCTAIIKPSAYAPVSSSVIEEIIRKTFPQEYITVIQGGRAENTNLLNEKFDYIFFTGSKAVGKEVMKKASEHLTPITLELGGKSPCIVTSSANIKIAARRIAFGKLLNGGQTCVAPDYILIDKSVKNEFIREYASAVKSFFPEGHYGNMCHIINHKHYARVKKLLSMGTPVFGGGFNDEYRMIEPTLMEKVDISSPLMTEEIFAPILPVLSYSDISTALEFINDRDKPLALYFFGNNKKEYRNITNNCLFGGGCVNDTIVHLANNKLPFGGVRESGMGAYHGKKSFDTFTHYTSILEKSFIPDLTFRYRPYTELKKKLIKISVK